MPQNLLWFKSVVTIVAIRQSPSLGKVDISSEATMSTRCLASGQIVPSMWGERDKQMLTCEEAATNTQDYICGKKQVLTDNQSIDV